MGRYQAYSAYKESGIEWLGEIPAHWEAKRVKFVVSKIGSGKTPKGGSEVYVDSGVMLLRSQNIHDDGLRLNDVVFITDEADLLQAGSRVNPNDVLLNITGASIGRASLIPSDFSLANVNQHVCIFRPQTEKITAKYLYLLFCSKQAKDQIFSHENGTSREGLNFQQAGNLTFAIPPLPEQQAIARFLDYKTAQIDALIANKEALLVKLAAKRTALISHAVTKGLDPTVPMKDSGIEWLGEIPGHWTVSRAKFVSDIFVPQRNKPELNTEDGTPWLTMDDMLNERISATSFKVNEESADKAGSKVLQKGAVIASCVGNFGIAAINEIDAIINQQLQAFIPYAIDPEYLREIVCISKDYFKKIATAATIVYVNQAGFANMPVILPLIDEQKRIIARCQQLKIYYGNLAESINRGIESLKQYRTALITNAVTGKIDVRDVPLPQRT